MDSLDAILKAIAAEPERGVFVSRSGTEEQRQLAIWIATRLKANGYIPILQDAHFKRADFMLAMDRTLASGARVLALMSREYLASEHCMKEAATALDDQLNASRRLVILRIDDCEPLGLLRRLDRVDFGPVWRTGDAAEMERVLLAALEAPLDLSGTFYVPTSVDPAQAIHPQVLMHDEAAFTGRERELANVKELLWNGGTAALTRAGAKGLVDEAVLRGMGGVGKTTLARAYAFRHRGEYHAVWWLRAESEETLVEDLIELGARFDPTLARRDDRPAAAREVLGLIANPGRKTNRPWLLVYDNAPGPGALLSWRPAANAHVIVTSRNPNWDKAVPLDVFSPETAVAFLTETARRTGDADKAEAAALAEQLGRLPLALAHAASKCRDNRRITFAAYGRRLAEFWRDRPDETAIHGQYGRSVWATFSIALDDIVAGGPDDEPCPEAETVIDVLAHLAPEQIPEFLLAPLYEGGGAAMPEAALDRALEALAAAGLVAWGAFEDGAPHLNVHRLVQEITRARLTETGRAAETAALATRCVDRGFSDDATLVGMQRNARSYPHAVAIRSLAPRSGSAAGHTIRVLLQSGDFRLTRGETAGPLDDYRAAQELVETLAATEPESDWQGLGWQGSLSVSHTKIGDVLIERGNLPAAFDAFQASLAISERLAKADPGNAGWQCNLAQSHCWVGMVLQDQGKLPDALAAYRRYNSTMQDLAKADPGNAGWQRDLSVSHDKIGDVLRTQGNLPAALDAFQASLAIRKRLAKADPENAGWQRDLSVAYNYVGNIQLAQGDLAAALNSYQAYFEIIDRLAKADLGNAGWQRDLWISHGKVGDVLIAQGNLAEGLTSWESAHQITTRLAKADPGNAGWQRDLSVSHSKIGDVLRAQGNLPAALDAYRADLAIAERLAKADPGNAGWQHDVALSLQRAGLLAAQQGQRAEALAAYQRGLDIMRRLTALAPDHADFTRGRAWFEAGIAELSATEAPLPAEEDPAKPAGGSSWGRWLKR